MAAVKIIVSIAQPFAVAGTPFSITTSVENAHEEEIELLEFLYHIPYQVQWINDSEYANAYDLRRKRPWYKRGIFSSEWKQAAHAPGEIMSCAMRTSPEASIAKVLPGETFSYSFKAYVPKWLFSSGGELVFPGTIKYKYKDKIHYSPLEVKVTLRPPLVANGIGAAFGAIVGSIAKGLGDLNANFFHQIGIEFVAATVLATIISLIAIVYSSRRTGESQPILTVEDFWGGLIVGFMVGYLGQESFQQFLPIANGA